MLADQYAKNSYNNSTLMLTCVLRSSACQAKAGKGYVFAYFSIDKHNEQRRPLTP